MSVINVLFIGVGYFLNTGGLCGLAVESLSNIHEKLGLMPSSSTEAAAPKQQQQQPLRCPFCFLFF